MSGMPLLISFEKISLVAVMIWPPKTERSLWIWQFEHVNFTGVILYSNRKVTKIKNRMREYMIKFCIIVIKSLWKRRWEFYKLSSLWALILRCGSFTEPAFTPSQTLSLVPFHLDMSSGHFRHRMSGFEWISGGRSMGFALCTWEVFWRNEEISPGEQLCHSRRTRESCNCTVLIEL